MAVSRGAMVLNERKTSIEQWGSSRAVRIPRIMCDAMGIDIGNDVVMRSGSDALGPFVLIRPVESGHRSYTDAPYISMGEVFEGYEGDYKPREADWGPDVGAEVIA